MGKNKLPKFAEMGTFSNVVQVPYHLIERCGHALKGNWNSQFFKNDKAIVLELGCGKGEYTVGLARIHKHHNHIGIDIKGSRMHTGAKTVLDEGLVNAGFLRTHIEMIGHFFAPNEVSEIWLTFPDPQMQKTRKRLTSTRFINHYRNFLKPDGIVHLKTDSNFQYQYTLAMAEANGFKIVDNINNVHGLANIPETLQIRTYYENQWISRGISIKYLSFIPHRDVLVEPDVEIEPDPYRSFGRGSFFPEHQANQ